MNVIAVQHDVVPGKRSANFDAVRRLLTAGETPPGSLIVLPEMFSTGYSMEVGEVAETKKRETEKFLSTLAWEYQSRHGTRHVALARPTVQGPEVQGAQSSLQSRAAHRATSIDHIRADETTGLAKGAAAGAQIALTAPPQKTLRKTQA